MIYQKTQQNQNAACCLKESWKQHATTHQIYLISQIIQVNLPTCENTQPQIKTNQIYHYETGIKYQKTISPPVTLSDGRASVDLTAPWEQLCILEKLPEAMNYRDRRCECVCESYIYIYREREWEWESFQSNLIEWEWESCQRYLIIVMIVFNWNHFEMRLLNQRINFYLLDRNDGVANRGVESLQFQVGIVRR